MTIKAVVFDLDDTLWPVAPVIQQAEAALHTWLAQHAPQVVQQFSIEQLRKKRNALLLTDARFEYDLWALRHTSLQQVLAEVGDDRQKADLGMAVFAIARNQVALYDDVMPGLQALGQRVKLGTISNGFADLQAIGLASHFQVSLAAHRFGCAKPDSSIFLAACEELQFSPHEIMFVGDDLLLDVQAAQQVGMQGVWMRRMLNVADVADVQHSDTVLPDAIVTNLHELLFLLN
jgi:putative hydrolase of the HAD superfamily